MLLFVLHGCYRSRHPPLPPPLRAKRVVKIQFPEMWLEFFLSADN